MFGGFGEDEVEVVVEIVDTGDAEDVKVVGSIDPYEGAGGERFTGIPNSSKPAFSTGGRALE
jgi:hypothetical protein